MGRYLVLIVILITIFYIWYSYLKLKKLPEGNAEMKELAAIIRDGASTFLKTEYKVIVIVVLALALLFSLFVEKTSGLTIISGAAMSSAACVLGMRSATYANVRTANRAKETLSIGETARIALRGGSISGLAVQSFGLLGVVAILFFSGGVNPDASGTGLIANLPCNPDIMRMTTYSLGCSVVAMFNRVAGGNYTKAGYFFRYFGQNSP